MLHLFETEELDWLNVNDWRFWCHNVSIPGGWVYAIGNILGVALDTEEDLPILLRCIFPSMSRKYLILKMYPVQYKNFLYPPSIINNNSWNAGRRCLFYAVRMKMDQSFPSWFINPEVGEEEKELVEKRSCKGFIEEKDYERFIRLETEIYPI